VSTSLDEPKHRLTKDPGWQELFVMLALVLALLIFVIVTMAMPLVSTTN
jgi:hypothetical protein